MIISQIVQSSRFNYIGDFVLDGEICIVEDNGDEDFKSAVSQVKKQSKQMVNAHYKLFDMIPFQDFSDKKSDLYLTERLNLLEDNFTDVHDRISILNKF